MTRKWIPIAAVLLFLVPVTVARQEEKQSVEKKVEKKDTPAPPPRVMLETSYGLIMIELDPVNAPKTTENFLRYVMERYYAGTIFYRVVNFSDTEKRIQGGNVLVEMVKKEKGLHPPIENEWKPSMKHVRGSVAMVREVGKKKSTQAEFFINAAADESLDKPQILDGQGFTVFGKVVAGMGVVDGAVDTELQSHVKYLDGGPVVPIRPMIIQKCYVVVPKVKKDPQVKGGKGG